MAMQPIDRQNAKLSATTLSRKVPQLINRTNKQTLAELVPQHIKKSRFQFGWHLHFDYHDSW